MKVPHQNSHQPRYRQNANIQTPIQQKQGKVGLERMEGFNQYNNSQIQCSDEVEHVGRINKWEQEDSQQADKNSRLSNMSSLIFVNAPQTIKIKPHKTAQSKKVKQRVSTEEGTSRQQDIQISKKIRSSPFNNQRKSRNLKIEDQSLSLSSLGNEGKSKEIKHRMKKLENTEILKHEDFERSENTLGEKQLKHFHQSQTIMDSRKLTGNVQIPVRSNSFSSMFKEKVMPVQRFLTFLLMLQIYGQFVLIVSLTTTHYWIFSTILLVFIPIVFAWQCIYKKIQFNKVSNLQESFNFSSSIYWGKRKREENISEMNEISGLKISKLHSVSNNEQERTVAFPYGFSRSNICDQLFHQKYLMVVPYLHNNQLHQFSKCRQCSATCINSRIKHCNQCHNCHFGFDHYCKFLAVCIDSTNYCFFLRFVLAVEIIGGILVGSQMFLIYLFWNNGTSVVAFALMILLLVETFLCLVFNSYIVGYHIWLSAKGVSTRQHFMGKMENPGNKDICNLLSNRIDSRFDDNFLQQIPFFIQNDQSLIKINEDFDTQSNNDTNVQSRIFDKQTFCQDDDEDKKTEEGLFANSKIITIHKIMQEPEPNEQFHIDKKRPTRFINNDNTTKEIAIPVAVSDNNNFIVNNESTLELNKRTEITDRPKSKEGERTELQKNSKKVI